MAEEPSVGLKSPKVTVLMSVYNGEKFLRESVESILKQRFEDFELLIVDDGSTDNTASILDSYIDPRIRIVRNKRNLGLTKSLNKGLNLARGEYVARMDADDVSLPERLGSQVSYLEKNKDVVLVVTANQAIDMAGNGITDHYFPINHQEIVAKLFYHNVMCHSAFMFVRNAICAIGGYDESVPYAQDYNLLLRAGRVGRLGVVPRILHKFRVNPETGITQRKKQEQRNCVIDFSGEFLKHCPEDFSQDQLDSFQRFQRSRLEKNYAIIKKGDISNIRSFFRFISQSAFGRELWLNHLFSISVHLLYHNRRESFDLFRTVLSRFGGLKNPRQVLRYLFYFFKSF